MTPILIVLSRIFSECINCVRDRSAVMVSLGFNSSQYTTSSWSHREYSVWPLTWRHFRAFSMIFALEIIVASQFFRRRSQCDVKVPSDSVFEAAVYKWRNAVQHLSDGTELNFLLVFGTSLQQIIRNQWRFSPFYRHAGPQHQNYRSWSVKTTHDTFFH